MNPDTFLLPVRDNITLRFIRPDEAEALYKLVDRNRAYLRKWLPWVDAQTGPEASKENILGRIEKVKTMGMLDLGIYLEGKLIGSMGFNRIVADQRKASIGYWISPEFQGKGIMTDCVRALLDYGFNERHLHRIRIQCSVNNKRSAAIPEQLGFTFEGIAREDEFLYDHFEDSRIYSILAQEWKSRNKQ
ncbi:MAG TPA: RimJ/RimL family protein N-acetyltransferase [Candidatus Taylorbacteria bacterium]|nr:MAG: Acetyltransferase [Parcubacteria group bacterium GW2011_GWA2_47_64]KKU96744.1 MAG: Acetyltransferase [Parcubacteria group bacterium GW2011_GWC2_48_17]HBV01073.1 RimJ/RimL family protein N-acetyltransferase [Candidatus Taylorbacteria bacterium]